METKDTPQLDLGSLGSFDFTPDWAKKGAGVSVGKVRPEREADDRPARGDGRGFGDRAPRQPGEGGAPQRRPFGDRKSFGDRKPFGDRKGGFGDRKQFGDRRPRFQERPKPLSVDVKILPATAALGTIIRKLQGDAHAYKLKDLAYFFLDNPSSVLLKVTPKADEQGEKATFFQCKACGFASTSQDDVLQHVLNVHLADYYDAKEIACEPPKGNFNCVAKCGLSGVLLGPPNIHEFNAVVKEMIRTKYPQMSEAEYRSRIEMVRDKDAIEQWRQGATKKVVFFPKGQAKVEGAAALSREQAEGEFKRTILPSLVESPKNLMITADVALESPVKPLVWAVRDALEFERRSPYNMCFALRGAFHHRKLHFFRANDARGPEFVTGVELKEFDAAHAIPELAKVATFIAENPCSPKVDIVTDEASEKQLAWLVTTGHVVAFTNGVFSAVEKYPKYGPQWQKRGKKAAPAAVAVPETEAAPAAPAPEAATVEDKPAEPPAAEAAVEAAPAESPVAEAAPAEPVVEQPAVTAVEAPVSEAAPAAETESAAPVESAAAKEGEVEK